MRPVKVEDKQLIEGLNRVFRTKGYEGASLNELAEGAGLKKASLYHRFPDGKKEIGSAVLQYSSEWLNANLYTVLIDRTITPANRLQIAISKISELYNQGNDTCILRALSMKTGLEIFGDDIKNEMTAWIQHFTKLGEDFGFDINKANQIAERVLVDVQGSLVVANAMADNSIFLKTLERIKDLYIK